MNEPAPEPLTVTPGVPTAWAFLTLTISEPLLGMIDPFGGETILVTVTGGREPRLGQVTSDCTRM